MDLDGVDTKVSDALVILAAFLSTDCTSVLWTLKFSFSDAMVLEGDQAGPAGRLHDRLHSPTSMYICRIGGTASTDSTTLSHPRRPSGPLISELVHQIATHGKQGHWRYNCDGNGRGRSGCHRSSQWGGDQRGDCR
jgi:hypothetical protein